jgi:hypothetical protein
MCDSFLFYLSRPTYLSCLGADHLLESDQF